MTISRIEKPASLELPPARLYLEDLEEIINIFLEAAKNHQRKEGQIEAGLNPKVIFRVGDRKCDDIRELSKIARAATRFSLILTIGQNYEARLACRRFGVYWGVVGLDDQEEWWMFRKLHGLFKSRLRLWRYFLLESPWLLTILMGSAAIGLVLLLMSRPPSSPMPAFPRPPLAWMLLYMLAFATLVAAYGHTIAIFRYSWEHAALRRDLFQRIIPVLIGALLGIVGTILVTYLRHRFWP
jgi:hypothetical protein